MFQSYHSSHLVLRAGLAIAFLWMGIQKFIEPHVWGDGGLPRWIERGASTIGMSAGDLFVLIGIIEVLIATSLVTAFFERWFALAGILLLFAAMLAGNHPETVPYQIGVIGSLLALAVWPQRRYNS